MEQDPNLEGEQTNIHQFFTNLLKERDERIKKLESLIEEVKNTPVAPISGGDWEDRFERLHSEHLVQKQEFLVEVNGYKSRINGLNQLVTKLRDEAKPAPAQLSAEPGNSKLEWGLGLIGLLVGIGLGILGGMFIQKRISQPKTEQARAFEDVQNKHQFNFEYEIANGRFTGMDSILKTEIAQTENAQIKPELEFLRQILKASRKKMEQHKVPMSDAEFAILPNEEITANVKNKGSITITEPTLSVRAEASASSEKLGTLKKDDVVKVMDRSHRVDKLSTRYEGKRAEVEDIWYKIEMPNGMEGWIFGYYTSASRQNMVIFADEGATAGTPVTSGAKPATAGAPAPAKKDTIKVIAPAQPKTGQ
jgi:Bacterial SH3 domain